jgi:thymidine phosphorylase
MLEHRLRLVRLGIDTHEEPVVYMSADCHVCRSEGFSASSRVCIETDRGSTLATLNVVHGDLVKPGEAGLSESAWKRLGVVAGQEAHFTHAPAVESLGALRSKIYGHTLQESEISAILGDVGAGRYTDVEIAALLTACTSAGMNLDEVVGLTRAMMGIGQQLQWERDLVVDKHCVGGLPGNRTTPIVVAIVAALGIWIPKTSSRAITSPAGTADAMETLAPVDLDLGAMKRVVEQESGCLVWGGAVRLSPVDDLLIRVERALDIDSEGQLVASVLSKKAAAGATHVVIDIPVGPTAKVRDVPSAIALAHLLERVAREIGLQLRSVLTDGTQPVGRGIGPALEALDVLAVLQGATDAPADLRERAISLAAELLEVASHCPIGTGQVLATTVLDDGRAWAKFQAICEAQGGVREPTASAQRWQLLAAATGPIGSIDNRRLARAAKLAGAPTSKAAGIQLHARIGDVVEAGQPLFDLHAESVGELEYARRYLDAQPDIVHIGSEA